ncbi:hemicentin-1-like [Lepeophtheirus salmonis]|uniref:hemicentin-1-like n=1 Tax=Lepeophtheirus salmonis TaxID=72036 RepID=UPI001AE219A9|nr:hemicentin-1-like [Lepeophtheirus salmonis]
MVNSNIERIQWHSGLLLILLPTLILAHLSLLGQEEDPLENGAILSYSESLTLVCPPLSEWRINGTKPASQESTLSFSSPPQSTLKIECLSSNKSEGSVSYSFLYLSQLNETLDPPPPISSLSLKPKTVLTYEETTSLTCSLDETQDEGVSYSFVWLKNGEIVSESSGSTFLLRNVTQSATYGCLLKDKDLSSLAYEETHVLVPSKIISPKENEQTIYLLPGSSYKEVCTANTPSVKWIQNGEALSVSSEFILQNVSEDTDLICIADNELGQDERKIHLIVVSPSVGPETQKINIYQDESKDLTCKAEIDERLISSSLLHYKWYLNGSLLENYGKDHFRIDSASDGDISGNYTCVIETPVEDVKVEYNVLVVSAPVIDSQFSKTLKVLKKSPYPSVQCSAHGDPEPRVSWIWSVDDKEVIVNESTLLSLNTSLAIDSTIFTCQAESVHGLTQRNFTLRAFEPTFVLQNDTTISVNASGKVILKCESAVDPRLESSSSITWLKDNKPLQHFITKDDEVLIPYLHLDHGGMYSCLTRTPLESVLVVQKLVVLVETPVIKLPVNVKRVTEGSDVSITCNASGVPHPSIHWKKDADNIKVSDGENLIIRHIGVGDTGHYSCLAVNEYGSKQESLSIEVYNKTTVAVDKETLISETSDLVVLECPVRLDKRLNIVSITWYKDGLNESISNETKLVIRNATKEDQGTYICRVETPVDVVNQTLRLTVLSEGPSFLSTEEDIRTLEGTNVTVNCQANGLPIPKISWTNNGVQILKGDDRRTVSPLGDLTIHYVSLNDQGNYTCTATNIYGSISTQSTIEVILRSKMATDFKKVKKCD